MTKIYVTFEVDSDTGMARVVHNIPGPEKFDTGDPTEVNAVLTANLVETILDDFVLMMPNYEDIDMLAETTAFMFCQLLTRRVLDMIQSGSTPESDVAFMRSALENLAEKLSNNMDIARSIIVDFKAHIEAGNIAKMMQTDPSAAIQRLMKIISEDSDDEDKKNESYEDKSDKPTKRIWRSDKPDVIE